MFAPLAIKMEPGIKVTRTKLLAFAGEGLGLMALLSPTVKLLYENISEAGRSVDNDSPVKIAANEEYWKIVARAFSIDRGNLNLNSGWTSPGPKMVTEAFVRYKHQEDVTNSTMWQMLEPQAETIRTGLARTFGCDTDEIAITRNASESLQILLLGTDIRTAFAMSSKIWQKRDAQEPRLLRE